MTTSIQDIVSNILDEDNFVISYRPSWREITGSVNATILLQQIRHRWRRNDSQPFYKFREPPKTPNQFYRAGDSWTEELGFTPAELKGALKKISKPLKKGELENFTEALADHFVGTFRDQQHRTWYYFNEGYFNQKLIELYSQEKADSPKANLTIGEDSEVPKVNLTIGERRNSPLAKGEFNHSILTETPTETPTENLSSSSTHAHASAQTHERTPTHETQSVPGSAWTQEHPPPAHLNPAYTDPKSEYRATPPSRGESPAFDAVVDLWKGDNLGVISRTIERELWEAMLDIEIHLSKHGVSGVGESAQAWLEYALHETAMQPQAGWRYTKKILANIEQAGSLARHKQDYEQGASDGSGTTATRKSKAAGAPGKGRANGATVYLDRNRENIERFRQAKVR